MKLEFCEPNFCNLLMNSSFSITLSPAVNWFQQDVALLYDDKSSELLYSNGADNDSTSVEIILDMGDNDFVSTVKLMNTNIKSGSISISKDNVTYTTLETITNNAKSSYHYYNSTADSEFEYLVTEDGELILTELGELIDVGTYDTYGRYIKVTMDTTQIPNDEKYIGELYIGRRVIKLIVGKLQNYRETFNNPRETSVRDYKGRRRKNRVEPIYGSTVMISRPSQDEAAFFRSIELIGGMYHLFPDADNAPALDQHTNIDQIYLVAASGNYNRNPYGSSADGSFSLTLMETKYIA